MAKRGRKKGSKNKKSQEVEHTGPRWFLLEHEVTSSIVGILLVAIAVVVTLAYFGLSGSLSENIASTTRALFGKGVFFFPLVLAIAGLYILVSHKPKVISTALLGGTLMLVSILGIFSLFGLPEARMGGWIGYGVGEPLEGAVGIWGSFVIFLAVLLSGILITFRIPLKSYARELIVPTGEDEKGEKIYGKKMVVEKGLLETVAGVAGKVKPKKKEVPPPLPAEKTMTVNAPAASGAAGVAGFSVAPATKDYTFPPFDLLEDDSGAPVSGDIKANAVIIQKTLENFGIPVEMAEVNVGPSVTQFTLKPATGVKLSKLTVLQNDLALALAAFPLRIEAPIPGKSLVGIEIPNKRSMLVRLRGMLKEYDPKEHPQLLSLALGRDVSGRPIFTTLTRMPHLLIAGSTGTGKSVAINSLLLTFLYQHSPEMLRFILIDPKRVELTLYNGIPHLLTPVITEPKKAISAFKWAVSEMERRYEVLAGGGARDVAGYNASPKIVRSREFMPYIVIVVDELADLMAAYGREVEGAIVRLAQMARAVGIHLILSTQRPSVEVITGLIKANITTRMAFQVASQVDSRTILDMSGADKLLGNGDMLFLAADSPKPRRIQGTYVAEKEVKRVVEFLEKQAIATETKETKEESAQLEEALSQKPSHRIDLDQFSKGEGDDDEMFEEAKQLVIESGKASASLLQRRLRVGYARAARLLDMMEEEGIVGPADGAKPREVFVSKTGGGQTSSTGDDTGFGV